MNNISNNNYINISNKFNGQLNINDIIINKLQKKKYNSRNIKLLNFVINRYISHLFKLFSFN